KGDEPSSELAISADGKRLAVCLSSGTVVALDLKTGTEVRRLPCGDSATSPIALALSPNGSALVLGKLYGDSSVRVWDVDSGKERLADAGHRGPAKLSLSADGKTLISRGAGQQFHWDLATGEGKAKPDDVKDPDGYIPDPTWSKMAYRLGRYRVAVEYGSGKIEVLTRDGSKPITSVGCPAEYLRGTAVSTDGRSFAVSFQDRPASTVLLWTPHKQTE